MSLRLVSVNVEGQKHLDTVGEFLHREEADVVCLMETCREDLTELARDKYPFQTFAPNDVLPNGLATGVAILSKTPIISAEKYYCGEDDRSYLTKPGMGTHAPVMILTEIEGWQIGAVHFSWTKHGSINERQRRNLGKLLDYLSDKGEVVLAGDFNIPRGNEMYNRLLSNYRDNIPPAIESTIDPILHYANKDQPGRLKTVVDYVWTRLLAESRQGTPKYLVSGVRVESGVSDHCALICEIDKLI